MSEHIAFSGPFVKEFHPSDNTGNRKTNNPAYPAPYTDVIRVPLRRVYLFIQNTSLVDIDIALTPNGLLGTESVIKLYANQSISFDNYNGGFHLSSTADINILEAFA